MPTSWFTADPHFGHGNIIHHTGRPFIDADEMDETILRNWNAVLKPGDRLYILGDFVGQRRPAPLIQHYFDLINLSPDAIVLVLGNHDNEQATRKVFRHVYTRYEYRHVKLPGETHRQRIVLDHYAMRVWNGSGKGTWHLYGHSHGNLEDLKTMKSFDVGVDSHYFKLLSFDDVAWLMADKSFVPVDHHGEST